MYWDRTTLPWRKKIASRVRNCESRYSQTRRDQEPGERTISLVGYLDIEEVGEIQWARRGGEPAIYVLSMVHLQSFDLCALFCGTGVACGGKDRAWEGDPAEGD